MIVVMDVNLVVERHTGGSDDDGDHTMLTSGDRWTDV